jgi:hypothetical protein
MFWVKMQITTAPTAETNKEHSSLLDCANTVRDCEHVGVTKEFAGSENILRISKNK